MEWNKKIYEHEVTPPPEIWDRIAHDLDNDHIVFREKLFHAQQTPPESVWEKIVHDLDNELIVFKDKLQFAQETPPANTWSNIQSILDNENVKKGRVISIPTIFKMSAAAAVIAILFFTTNYFVNTKEPIDNTTAQKENKPQQEVAKTDNAAKDNGNGTNPLSKPEEKEKSFIASNTDIRKNKKQETNQQLNVYSDGGSFPMPSPEFIAADKSNATDKYDLGSSFNKRVQNLKGEIKEDISLLDLPNSYFLMTGPDGQSIRVSAKFRNTIQYLNGSGNEELLDVILRESQYWKNIFRDWKEKMNTSTFIPSVNNFMDIAELMQLLHQNKSK